MGGNTEEEGNCMVLEIHLKEWAVLKIYCVSQPWGMTPGKWVPIDGLKQVGLTEGLWETKLCSWRVCTWLLIPPPQKKKEGESNWNCLGLWTVFYKHSSACFSSNWVYNLKWLALQCSSRLGQRLSCQGEHAVIGDRANSNPVWHMNNVMVTIVGTDGGSGLEWHMILTSAGHPIFCTLNYDECPL